MGLHALTNYKAARAPSLPPTQAQGSALKASKTGYQSGPRSPMAIAPATPMLRATEARGAMGCPFVYSPAATSSWKILSSRA
jgi:hypothetical protein